MTNVLLVEKYNLVTKGLRKLLEDYANITIVDEAHTGEDAIKIARERKPQVALVDMNIPNIGGLETTRRILYFNPPTRVIALTVSDEDPFSTRFLQMGGSGYLNLDSSVDEIVTAINRVQCGQRYIKPEIAQRLAVKNIVTGEDSLIDELSERELQILLMISYGQTVKEIANSLHLCEKTIHSYRYRLHEKLNAKNDVELAHLALRKKLIEHDALYI